MNHLKSKYVSIKIPPRSHQYEIEVGAGLLAKSGEFTRKSIAKTAKKIGIISNKKVFGLYGESVIQSLENEGFQVFVYLIGDGERHKNFRTLEKTLAFFSANKLTRNDAVIALGGGVVGDLTGFAASIFQRGIPFLQIPTTVLSQIDSSVGGKTAVNSSFGKNLTGTFCQPNGVLIDIDTLKTLPKREIAAGFAEAIKQGAIASEKLFSDTSDFLNDFPLSKFRNHFLPKESDEFCQRLINLITEQITFKAEIVANDEQENISRDDFRSRKILNFGHTIGHALEKVTRYRRFKHGEAVALGILAASEISKNLAYCDENLLTSLKHVVHSLGVLPRTDDIETDEILSAISHDKKSVGGEVQWILIERIGKPIVVKAVNEEVIRRSLKSTLKTIQ